jgi:ATP-dependent RNA helicase RhlE
MTQTTSSPRPNRNRGGSNNRRRNYSSNKNTNDTESESNRGGYRGHKSVGSRPGGGRGRPDGNRGGGNRSSSKRGGNRHGGNRRGGNRGGRKIATFDPSQFINKNPVEEKQEVYVAKHTFNDFGFNAQLVRNIERENITTPSPIQDQIIPEILKGHDVIGLAETGTGKTAAFLLPLIQKHLESEQRENKQRRTLILAPTRELAIQIENELRKFTRGAYMHSVVCVGGTNINPQIKGVTRHENKFVIGTPGRVLDLIKRGDLKLQNITSVVLDEADRMLDMGFIHDMRAILSETPDKKETLFFSATTSPEADRIVHDFLKDPITISVKKKEVTNSIEQDIVSHGHHDKFETLTALLAKPEFGKVLIFGSMKHSVERLSRQLTKDGFKSVSIHGNKSHVQRQRALKNFKDGEARVMVATDVAARGIHVDEVTHVINYDLPGSFEDYVHRIGRTGRGDKKGKALTFVAGRG